ncbi:hypothetical protein KEM48_002179 [Puccinia striiformis f. sp. tritici PST-130]|uniref:Uncharacterized protein n=1 Tax=Puccinia striiformis f. sp. tritici PST-78 TaxID=1165861 RepID=A0A0L0UVW3_9BASI|nr:hypothetical protein H4Q26_002497 [Puccinia striiformis f. sp. tritici PST-130]KAI9605480.1 hypothetical protein KEM48_002179 [Puccinia striiformis f. sp. tritici PST-130]KNE91187.1 hypothetical protein PSTG_15391 [Puccinia striiformis f. sp. tritici PST-78]
MSDMAQSKNEPSDKLNLQLPGKQGNFIIRFQRLTTFVERCYVPADQHHDRATIEVLMSTSSIDEAGLKEITLDRLQSTLPLLKSQLTALAALARLLDLSCLQQQTESRIKRVMLLQAVFGQTMDYINFDIALVGTESTCKAKRSNDQDLGRVNVNELLKSSNGGLSPGELEFHTQAHGVLACHRYTHKQAARFIDTTIEPIDGFKWAPAQKGWTGQLERADVRWRKMVDSTNPGTLVLPELKYMHMGQTPDQYETATVIHRDTEMCCNEVSSEIIGLSPGDLVGMIYILCASDLAERAPNYNKFIQVTERLKSRFGVPLRAALLHLVPSILATDESTVQNYYRSWIRNWNTQLVLAIDNLSRHARSVDGNRS